MNKNKKIIFTALLTISIVSGLLTAYALTSWSETGTFTLPPTPNPSFQVNSNTPSGQTVNLGPVSGTVTRTYTILNNGNVEITVSGSVTANGCSGSLDKTQVTLAVGASTTFTLTLTDFASDGQYSLNFAKV